ncbi:nuclear transport factor 2 family protein [Streptomyces spectabilis]|uniref:SnoaL-like domain-containing protein n=1 Tax=Streptomyces spectabilis TaxID=68270 RepID=A0A516RJQ9_STRST|nr:nuclear transport factor 2 family protein [Streptomyces spectabilis]QDQ15898.1 hypothetical protein FH965_39520 [Streptomyces spectabilis]
MDTAADTHAVTNLIARYAELVDTGDVTDAAFLESGAAAEGSEAVGTMLRDTVIRYEDGTPRTHHATTSIAVESDRETVTARARSYVTVFPHAAAGLSSRSLPGLRRTGNSPSRNLSCW